MITQITLQNIRLFNDDEWTIPTPRLTVFCGTNSAGKSTILKTLLLLRQSQGIQESQGTRHGYLRFTGTQADVGDYTSYVSHNDTSKDITIGITVESEAEASWISYLSEANSDLKTTQRDQDNSTKYQITAKLSFRGVAARPQKDRQNERCRLSAILNSASYIINQKDTPLLHWHIKNSSISNTPTSEKFDIYIPQPYFEKLGGQDMMEVGATDQDGHVIFSCRLNGLLPESFVARLKTKDSQKKREAWSQWPLPPHIDTALSAVKEALTKMHYMGPLRSPGKRFYLTHLDDRPNLDQTGETLPSILRDRMGDQVWNCSPFNNLKPTQMKLGDALKPWLHYFRTGTYNQESLGNEEVELTITSDVLVEVKIKSSTNNEFHALTDSGFGYSQVLPIIIRGLLAERNSTTLIEQPELHLNPALQVRLGHFLVAMIRCGKQIIIETHSEHIVNTIRVLCAEDESQTLHNDCSIIYLATSDGKPDIHELSIRPNGMVAKWPKDFFGEAPELSARLLRAQKQNRTNSQASS